MYQLWRRSSISIVLPIRRTVYCKSTFATTVTIGKGETVHTRDEFISNNHGNLDDGNNQRQILDRIAKELHIKDISDWYKLTNQSLVKVGGSSILQRHGGSLSLLLSAVYPEHDWQMWKFNQTPRHYWDDVNNQRKFMDWLSIQLNIKDKSDWYKATKEDIKNNGGSSLLLKYNGSVARLLAGVYPDYKWQIDNFPHIPRNYWGDVNNQRQFMDSLANKLNIKDYSDWYKVTKEDIIENGGTTVLGKYNNSPSQLLAAIYPEYEWLPWRFVKRWVVQSGNLKSERQFMDRIAVHLKIKDFSDWYKVSPKQIIDLAGGYLLVKYSTLNHLFSTLYKEINWNLLLFDSRSVLEDVELAKYFVEWLQRNSEAVKYLHKEMGLQGFPRGVLTTMLSQSFPEYKWTSRNVDPFFKKSQFTLKECLKTIFPGDEVVEDYRHSDFKLTDSPLELDYFYPKYNLAFEYQGRQHYAESSLYHSSNSLDQNKLRDKIKTDICKEKGITLIEIPYWWDRKVASLTATIYQYRPDLFSIKPQGTPISLSAPASEQKQNPMKDVLMTATEWDSNTMEPNGWWMTEKYDGMRLYWDGYQFYSRQGEKLKVPLSITSQLPNFALDGELWTQYGLYQEAVNLGNTSSEEKWKKAIFWVFDAPNLADQPFEERMKFLQNESSKLPSFVRIIETIKCTGKEHLKEYLNGIIAKGGEGVMLREPGSIYKSGRSSGLRRCKPFYDTEVKVIENQYPHGFMCQQMNGKTVFVHTKISEEAKKVKEGDIITVKHSGLNTYGTLQYPQFYREKFDVKWTDLIKT